MNLLIDVEFLKNFKFILESRTIGIFKMKRECYDAQTLVNGTNVEME